MHTLPRLARLYVIGVITAGAGVAAVLLPSLRVDRPVVFLALLAIACATARVKLQIPFASRGATLSLSYAITLGAMLVLGIGTAVILACVSAWVQTIDRKDPTPLYRRLFSLASSTLTIVAAGSVYARLGGISGTNVDLVALAEPLTAAVAIYFAVNTGLVSLAVALVSGKPVVAVWKESFLWTGPTFFAGGLLVAVCVTTHLALWLLPLASAPLYFIYYVHQIDLRRHEEQQQHMKELTELHLAMTEALARAIDAKDQVCQGHIRRVQTYATTVARALGMSDAEVEGVRTAAMLHDIGKIGVPDYILSKPGPLTREEFQRVRRHPVIGAEIIAAVPSPYPVSPYVRSHHERWDGEGYPDGLRGQDIPLGARILAVVDYFDALVSDRPYHAAMTHADAFEVLTREAGTALDPTVVARFVELADTVQEPPEAQVAASLGDLRVEQTSRPANGFAPSATPDTVFHDIASVHREVYALYEIAHSLGTTLSVEDTMALIESKLSRLVPFSSCALFLYDDEQETLRCRSAKGIDAEILARLVIPNGAGVNGWVVRHRRPVVNGLAKQDVHAAGLMPFTLQLNSALAWPLILGDRFIGTLALYHVDSNFYTDEHCLPLEHVCEQVAAVVHNALTFEQTQSDSLTDPLTHLANIRHLSAYLSHELLRGDRQHAPVALLMFDVDGFKAINDRFGHHLADHVLCDIARTLQAEVRPYDLCARYAGDEFLVVLSGCDRAAAEQKRLALCAAIEQLTVGSGADRMPVRLSSGLAVFPEDGGSYADLLAVADARMYGDKAAHKGQVCA